jgi:hypothetical protein
VQVAQEIALLHLEECLEVGVLAGPVPERADVDAHDLRRVDDLTKGPHHRAVDAHQLLARHLVGLVQHNADLVVLALERLDHGLELVGDVELVRVEEQQNEVCALREPLCHLNEVIRAAQLLLLAREHTGRIDKKDLLKHGRGAHGRLELVQKLRAELGQAAEGHRRVDREGIAGDDAVLRRVHDGVEAVRRRLRPDACAGEIAANQVPNERGLTHGVLTEQQHHGLCVEVGRLHRWAVKLACKHAERTATKSG